jgi:simple sugar transport system ATP-binding protein
MMGNARVLILDEPTPIMAPEERTSFFQLLHRLKAQGKAVVIVTHRLQEAVEECDDITVLRGGRTVAAWTNKDLPTEPQILEAMIGTSDLARGDEGKRRDRTWESAPALAATGVVAKCSDRITVQVDRLQVRPGEILGVAGIEGSGQRELATLLVGQTVPDTGTVELLGKRISDYSNRELCKVVGDVPDEPELATAGELSIWQNLSLPSLLWQGVTWPRQRRELKHAADDAMLRFNVKAPNSGTLVANLSGGNKRRVVLARETYLKSPAVIVLTYATRGLDAKAASGLLEHVQSLSNDGTAVVFISSDLEELLTICDSVCPVVDGRVGVAVPNQDLTQTDLARMMLGLDGGAVPGARTTSDKETV